MANDNIKDFTVQWILFGLLLFSMLTFALFFSVENNPIAYGNSKAFFQTAKGNISTQLQLVEKDSDSLLNITSNTNPEVSDLGSRDSVATSYGIFGTARGMFTASKYFISVVFSGTFGEVLLTVFGGLFGLSALYFITKYIRTGV